jgi:transposase
MSATLEPGGQVVVAERHEPGALIQAVAARHGVCESLVVTWRRQVRDGVLVAPEMPVFMPVQMLETPGPTVTTLSSPRPVLRRRLAPYGV